MNWSALLNKTALLLLLPLAAAAQETYDDYKKTYPDFNELIVNETRSYNLSIVKKKLEIIQDNYQESIILSEPGIYNNEESFSYSDLVKVISYDAYTSVNTGGKEKKYKVTQANEKRARDNAIFHDDVKEKQLIFPNLEIGAKKIYQYQAEFTDPFLLHHFVFANAIPIKNATLEVVTDKDIEIGYKVFNDKQNQIAFTKSEKKGKTVYRWTAKNISPVKFEANNPGILHDVPHINVYVKQYKIDDNSITVLDDTNKLYSYYQGFVKDLNKTEDADLKALTAELTAGKTNDADKLKSIFYWVKDNVKYIAFENGYEGFIPREAATVFQRKFGDCKDMASIITAMANYAGIKGVSLAWIGTREIPYSYNDLATPAVDNHMIAAYKTGNDYIFLDATDKETRYGIPTAFIQGKEAMIGTGNGYEIVKVPTVKPEDNLTSETVSLKIDGEKLIGTGQASYTGHTRSHYLMQIGDATGKQRFEMVKSLVLKGSNKFHLDEYTEENQADRDKPYLVNYKFTLDNYIVKVDNDLYVNLFLDRFFENNTIEPDRVSGFEFEFLNAQQVRYALDIPAGYAVQHVPKDFSEENDLFRADFKYEQKNGTLTLIVSVALKKLLLTPADFAPWNETVKKLKANYNETIILTKK